MKHMAAMTEKGKRALLAAFDALNAAGTCDPAGHAKGRTMVCAVCRASNGDKHNDDCPVGAALTAFAASKLIPPFFDRGKWIAE